MENDIQAGSKRVLKFVVVGEMATGKTSIIRQFVQQAFSEFYKSTIGVDFARKTIKYSDDLVIDLQLWDISGQERFASVTHMYYNEAIAALVVFDLMSQNTLDVAAIWKKDIDEKVRTSDEKPIPSFLIGNKLDLTNNGAEGVSDEAIAKICNENGFIKSFKTSARNDVNIKESIESILHYVLENNIHPFRPKELDSCVNIKDPKRNNRETPSGCCH